MTGFSDRTVTRTICGDQKLNITMNLTRTQYEDVVLRLKA